MSEPKFTPGPWKLDGLKIKSAFGAESGDGVKAHKKDCWSIADCLVQDITADEDGELADLSMDVIKANARLIACAPELFAMVEELTHFVEDVSGDSVTDLEQHYSLIERANDLLAKARGESQK